MSDPTTTPECDSSASGTSSNPLPAEPFRPALDDAGQVVIYTGVNMPEAAA